ncbi:MAG: N-(5'-phosphoribosyl)anthranilate isomerase [Cytophagales bacterium]|nr:N-(5'-phosphoribosyl)anthranilate isomerase [Cytophagales bacterium]
MALKCFVKVGNVTNLSDARYCAGMGVDLLGFPVDAVQPGHVTPAAFAAIAGWVAGVQFVGEVEDADTVNLTQLLGAYPLDWLQVSRAADWAELRHYDVPLICRVDWETVRTADRFFETYAPVAPHVSYFLLESEAGTLDEASRAAVAEIAKQYPVLLGFGLEPATVEAVLVQTAVRGIALKGSQEIRPGYKDFGALADLLETLEE